MKANLELTLNESALARIISETVRWRLIDEDTPSGENLVGMRAGWPHPYMIFRQTPKSPWQFGWIGVREWPANPQPTHFYKLPDFFESRFYL